jgi:hypothetical protein
MGGDFTDFGPRLLHLSAEFEGIIYVVKAGNARSLQPSAVFRRMHWIVHIGPFIGDQFKLRRQLEVKNCSF